MKRLKPLEVILLSLRTTFGNPSMILLSLSGLILTGLLWTLAFLLSSFLLEESLSLTELSSLLQSFISNLNTFEILFSIISILEIAILSFMFAALCGMVREGIASGKTNIGDGIFIAKRRFFQVFILNLSISFIIGMILIGGSYAFSYLFSGTLVLLLYAFLMLISSLIFALFIYTLPAIVVDDFNTLQALLKSFSHAIFNVLDTLGILILFLSLMALSTALSIFIPKVGSILSLLISLILPPFGVTLITVAYVNLK
ncbi:MAG: hypothetical protein ACE5K0_09915 [Candidatus Methanofastidiosia archaeon]